MSLYPSQNGSDGDRNDFSFNPSNYNNNNMVHHGLYEDSYSIKEFQFPGLTVDRSNPPFVFVLIV